MTPVHDDGNPRMHDALASLRQIVAMQRDHASASELGPRGNSQSKSQASTMQNLQMPPMATVLGLLRQIKESSSNILESDLPFIENDEFVEMCRNVYFNADDFTEATFIIVNAGLYHIFAEESYATDNPSLRQEYQGYEELCQENLEAAFARLPLCLPATPQNIKALLIGTVHTIGHNCRPALAWNLITTAARMCQTLGYHRQEVMRKEEPQSRNLKALVFWYVYVLENALALRLGYSSVIRLDEVTITRNIDRCTAGPWSSLLGLSVKLADIQANLYELLYSPRASTKPRSQIADCARRLSRELEVIMEDAKKARSVITEEFKPTTQYQDSLDLALIGDEITCYTTLTMITRAIPAPEGSPNSFCDECLDAARRVMQMHQACVAASATNLELQVAYIHWSIILTPFAPFFVLFCQTIGTSSAEDLARIRDFADSLLPASRISDQVRKLQRLCHVFCNVATTYLEAKSRHQQQQQQQQQQHQQHQQHQQQIDNTKYEDQDMMQIGEFDVCLGALGLMQPDVSAQHHHHNHHQQGAGWPAGPDGLPMDPHDPQHHQSMGAIDFSLGDWFAGSRDIMGLLDGGMAPFGTPPEGM
ncbi:fungal specific transcription factor domain-containing protein [Magnaporthiopsis poae ATCC 64411]|uniref:Fungal specific transcription factor domain-containing protein n=1 Tax=Magnaporthiopsis poae (strain ATCC 64411 / 73-15) TaxID=644358 RepID=A0A0C4E4X4_MAGP6|nr:fungal specific transcription factor domain-containing protein [Magnaporthiopsis poae ATCC 64411]